ncbi:MULTISPECIES: tellurite resistance/C4-dicarboxylate transporter family protein [unclassified Microbacterium]|uniref:tellurite resistance/C4-dicarboxylate transporter family protein n=1 Tax=unclassified Microbacterium TaxID=2609290 RepID=UPI00049399CC|nr:MULTISPECIES: tellurite resistance/C4-dicarboxylate transporter family protein [unclassified Microbacterium]MCV0335828.1 tellurite resistance/C4-dicarboxylate transporter family protein [Microbacterium sp.]MCV0376792.1 tellurite resistance/C4-dicarboxylate transporter family protein [Microbacterium sp.]MCV0391541.1 tellurite resistance/C4-dicarboxylate transporter family protein [Microbacterium sp.]MCV0419958.1 tellurite resistance/C4-dicarboxylate transporter family protein [Microbacterium 
MSVRTMIERLPPAGFSFVMATGIVGTSFVAIGLSPIGAVAFVLAVGGYALLLIATVARVLLAPAAVLRDAGDPGRAFGFFTIVAATGVTATLGASLGAEGILPVALALEALLWALLTYGMLPWLVTHASRRPLLRTVDGGWFLLVVATQSLSVLTSATAGGHPLLGLAAFALWCLGIVLYLLLMAAVTVRLLGQEIAAIDVAPTAWVLTGSTAISTLAAARLLTADSAVLPGTEGAVTVVAMALWSFGTFLIPFLVGLGIRDLRTRPGARRFTVGWWSIVFPIGMYATATIALGRAAGVGELVAVGTLAVWCGAVAWVLVSILAIGLSVERLRSNRAATGG